MNSKVYDLSPSPSSLMESLRDIGYSIETAVADIIDNSITAQSTEVNIRFAWNSIYPWFAVVDNGYGMEPEELINAMRFGSLSPQVERSATDLGRFGLGMKTASFSQCRHLTVISKKNNLLTGCEWDLDAISCTQNKKWLLRVLDDLELKRRVHLNTLKEQFLDNNPSGTIVMWEKIDRIDQQVSKKQQEVAFNNLIELTKQHLELVFHRYLAPVDKKTKKVTILVNGKKLNPFDPFNTRHPTTIELPEEQLECEAQKISIQPFVLPHHNKIGKEQYELYAGKEGYVFNQGFYVYRNRRLIIKGTWFRLIKKSELTKLVRVRVDIPNTLDHLWKIDVKKSNATPPESIRKELKRIINKIEYSGKKVYHQRGQKLQSNVIMPAWERRVADNQVFYEINRSHTLVKKFIASVDREKAELFNNLLRMFEGNFPSDLFFNDFATSPEKLSQPKFDVEQLNQILNDYIVFWELDATTASEKISELLQVEPFSSNIEATRKLLSSKGILN